MQPRVAGVEAVLAEQLDLVDAGQAVRTTEDPMRVVLVRHRVTRLPVPDLDRAVLRVQDRVAQECRVYTSSWEVRAAGARVECRNAKRACRNRNACECDE